MVPQDVFGRTDTLPDDMLENLVVRFEVRGKHPLFSEMLRDYLDAMNIVGAATVLDLGCGTGLAARAIAQRPGFFGKVTGVDLSPYLVAAATHLAVKEGLTAHVGFQTGNAHRLDFADHAFDALVAHTLLSHIEDPLSALREAARVVKPGGVIGIFDGDYASLTFDHGDTRTAKANDDALIRTVATNPRVMRQIPRLLRSVGLELVTSFSYVLSEVGTANFWWSAIETYSKLMPKVGTMTEDEANAWAAALRSDSDARVFFGSSNYYAYVAKRL